MDRPQANSLLYANSSTFGSADARFIERSFVASVRRFRNSLLYLVDDLASGSLDVPGFTRRSVRALIAAFREVYALGALSVDPFHTWTTRDLSVLGEEIGNEKKFLRAFGTDLKKGFYTLDPFTRAGLYVQAMRGIFELGRIQAAPAGPYAWKLGDTDHCLPCIEAALGGPYQRDQYSHLGLPPLPGTPGSGEVCRGLTRCGCTIVMADGLPLPNSDLPTRLRESLLEVIHDGSYEADR